ncbi:MAG TPA: 50S ribosomal protein L19 [Dehalococcoidia bacterium]|nr:50S ribosomal protein L19 [Dehalococcoidia bacterium]
MTMESLTLAKPNPKIPELAPGDTVRVSIRVVEGGKERIQPFQGVVIKVRRGGVGASFTVRRIAYGVGVERTFPLYSPRIEKVEVIRHGKVRRARLYYLRGRSGKAARIKERRVDREKKLAQVELEPEPEPEPVEAQEELVQEAPEAAQVQEAQAPEAAEPVEAQEAPEEAQAEEEQAPQPEPVQAQGEQAPEEAAPSEEAPPEEAPKNKAE